MSTDERMDRRDFLRKTGFFGAIGVSATTGSAAAQETDSTDTGTESEGTDSSSTESGGTESSGTESGTESAETGTEGSSSGGGATGPIDFGGFLDSANGWSGSAADKTGADDVTIEVGAGEGMAFSPAGVHVSPGTTVVWEWTGEGGAHNVVSGDDAFSSGSAVGEAGTTFEHTFEEAGIYNYHCEPHEGQGMIGSVAVGEVPRKEPMTPQPPAVDQGTKNLGVATFATMVSTLGLAYFFLRYGGDYEQ
ncbi:halocyanin domain-containing protein [Halocatena halophila]|uniref:halocyanin domain-containing protein n=1 Tax=Halocatena halophila TaxID=2814576 RepID=UPI002ED636D9